MNEFESESRSAAHPDRTTGARESQFEEVDRDPQLEYVSRGRRWLIPTILFVLTCLSTFWVGVTNWQPMYALMVCFSPEVDFLPARRMVLANWDQGLIYMACVLAILLTHEMGHFIATLIYRVPATPPIFLPFPFNPIGTLGAVIGMQGNLADRKQIFDIGIAGPLAGLVVAVPLAVIGVMNLDFSIPPGGRIAFECPLLIRWMITWLGVEGYSPDQGVWISQLNPYFAAAWVGLLVTGLNMVPVGQLDGGHITYCLFGKSAHYLAQGIIVVAIAFMVYYQIPTLIVMVLLLLIIGTNHPPTRNDNVKLGAFRSILGIVSLTIPLLCFPPLIFKLSM